MYLQGILIFLLGNILQFHSHFLLAGLTKTSTITRRRSSSVSGTPRYRIPKGGAFEFVSCPHYLGEIVIYLGLAILMGTRVAGPWFMVAWVVSLQTSLALINAAKNDLLLRWCLLLHYFLQL